MTNHFPFLPDNAYAQELVRPWKLLSFGMAMGWLLYGALNYHIGDWDVGVTLIMGGLTYLTAPWSVSVICIAIRYRPPYWVLWILSGCIAWLFVVDWVYLLYHALMENPTYRADNFYASSPLYFMAGVVWLYRGSLFEMASNLKRLK